MIEIHSKTNCPYCHKAKAYLTENGIAYQEYLYDDYTARQAMYDKFGLVDQQRTVPQIFLIQSGLREYIGGYSKLINANLVSRLQMENFNADF